jgi:hypothetical protein
MHVSVDPPATQGTITVTALAGKSAALTGNTPPSKNKRVATNKIRFFDLLSIMHLLDLLSFLFVSRHVPLKAELLDSPGLSMIEFRL